MAGTVRLFSSAPGSLGHGTSTICEGFPARAGLSVPDCSFRPRSSLGFASRSLALSVPVRSYAAAVPDTLPRNILPGVAGRHRAWAQPTAATGNHIQAVHTPLAHGSARSRSAKLFAI